MPRVGTEARSIHDLPLSGPIDLAGRHMKPWQRVEFAESDIGVPAGAVRVKAGHGGYEFELPTEPITAGEMHAARAWARGAEPKPTTTVKEG